MGAGSREREDFGEGAHVIQETGGTRTGRGGWCVLTRGGSEVDHHGFVVREGETQGASEGVLSCRPVMNTMGIIGREYSRNRKIQNASSLHVKG